MTRPTKAEREFARATAALERSRKRLVTSALIIARELVDGALTDYGLMEFDRLRDASRSVEHFTHRIGVLRRAITRERKKAVGRLGAVGRPGSPGAGAAVTAANVGERMARAG